MHKKIACMVVASSLLTMTGCDKVSELTGKSKIECSDPQAIKLVTESMQKSINSEAKSYTEVYETRTTGSSIRASINQIKMDLSKIRTTKDDPQSSKNFCMGTLKVSIPTNMVEKANFTRDYYDEANVEEDAYQQDILYDANTAEYEAEYSVQPTDDGEVIFVDMQNGADLSSFLAKVVVDSNQKANIQKLKAREKKAEAQSAIETQNAIKEAESELDEALRTAKSEANSEIASIAAEQAKVKAEMDYKRSEFNKMWGNATKEEQELLTESQKNWVEWRDEVCVDEAKDAEPARQEIVRMQCITRLLSDRYYEVKEFFDTY